MLGLSELEKHAPPRSASGAWFALPDGRQLHLGVEKPFRASRKAHPAFAAADLDKLAGEMEAAGSPVRWDDGLVPRQRFYGADPFGNMLEFLEP